MSNLVGIPKFEDAHVFVTFYIIVRNYFSLLLIIAINA